MNSTQARKRTQTLYVTEDNSLGFQLAETPDEGYALEIVNQQGEVTSYPLTANDLQSLTQSLMTLGTWRLGR